MFADLPPTCFQEGQNMVIIYWKSVLKYAKPVLTNVKSILLWSIVKNAQMFAGIVQRNAALWHKDKPVLCHSYATCSSTKLNIMKFITLLLMVYALMNSLTLSAQHEHHQIPAQSKDTSKPVTKKKVAK